MAHKTLVGGTDYGISGGKCLIGGTAYSIKNGRTLVGGTGYDIPFGPTLSPVLDENSWEAIRYASDNGLASSLWSVGDTKTITINGKMGLTSFSNVSIDVFIIGFDHNKSLEGSNRIHFQIGKKSNKDVALYPYLYDGSNINGCLMNQGEYNVGGWEASYMRNSLLGNAGDPTSPPSGSLLASLPEDLRAVMKSVKKYTDNTGEASKLQANVTVTSEYLFLLSPYEFCGTSIESLANAYERNKQSQYEYYNSGNAVTKYGHSRLTELIKHWTRSPRRTSDEDFCMIYTGNPYESEGAMRSLGISPAFCV